jgi:large subunit ribosomal protein L1
MAHGKRYKEAKSQVDAGKTYSVEEAVALVKKTATAKFDSSVEIHVNLGIDPKKGDQMVRGTVALPHGIGKEKKICVFAGSVDAEAVAKEAGAALIGGEELIAEIGRTGKIDFDIAVATPDMMPKLAKIAKILGPRGLMPSPKNETVTTNVKKTVEELKRGRVAFKNDETANVHQIIGKVSFDDVKLVENFTTIMDALRRNKPSTSKGVYLKSVTVTSTMGPGIKVTA